MKESRACSARDPPEAWYDVRYPYRIALGVHDDARAEIALKGIAGKRLTCCQPFLLLHDEDRLTTSR
jgi:hypothetical protein